MTFEYPEDREFFANLLANGDAERLEKEFADYFDFRHPAIKREEFDKNRKRVLKDLLERYGTVCQLRLHEDCSKVAVFEPDHIIPLSSNELNKKLRHVERVGAEKVPRQSFGSNHPKNLTLACKRCNAFKKHRLILPAHFNRDSEPDFLKPYRIDSETVTLPSGDSISLPKYLFRFKTWNGEKIFDYGGKPLIDSSGEACFAELAILRLFRQNGWCGAWVETYGGTRYLNSMPKGWKLDSDIEIPVEIEELIRRAQSAGSTSACFDVVVWQGDTALFVEAKRQKKDRLNDAQKRFIQGALASGLPPERLIIAEWEFKDQKAAESMKNVL